MPFLTSLLEYYHMTLKDLDARRAKRSFDDIQRPEGCAGFQKVVSRLEEAIKKNEKIVLYGDYDVDGLTATAILKRALDKRGATSGFFIPSRYVEGYGLNKERVDQFVKKGYQVLVTLDNGISANEAISYTKKEGMTVLVIDHHELPEKLPDADGIFHQKLDCFLPYNCSAASLSYFVASALMGMDDNYLAFLAGLAVFSDVMPLVGNNLVFAKLALQNANAYRFKNLGTLLSYPLSYEDLSFQLIPMLNAPGRIKKDSLSTNWACQFLIREEDELYALNKADFLKDTNAERKELVKHFRIVPGSSLETTGGLVFTYDGLSGLSGLIANRYLREKGKTIAAFCQDEKDGKLLVGSFRSQFPILSSFLKGKKDLFLRCGGHDRACGVTLEKKDYYHFATAFLTYCEKARLENDQMPEEKTIDITLEDLCEENFLILDRFEPFGEGFPAPVFSLTCATESIRKEQGRFEVLSPDGRGKAICFKDPSILKDAETTTFVGSLSRNVYNGRTTYTLMADHVRQD